MRGGAERPGVAGVMERALDAARTLPHRSDFAGWRQVPARGEFRFPGRGATFDLMTVGVTGVAYTRGADLLAFKKIRV